MTALRWVACGVLLTAGLGSAQEPFETVFYKSGKLRIQAYLYKPEGKGPFPVVIYNHGSRAGNEKRSTPFRYVGEMLTGAGYVVLVPERRGYGESDGALYSDEVGTDRDAKFVARMQTETGDVLASLDYLKTLPYADMRRVGIMGWSLGGIVSVFGAARSDVFRVVVDQAGASLTWAASAAIRKEMRDAAGKIHVPVLAMGAENDRTTDAVRIVAEVVTKNGQAGILKIYPSYTPSEPLPNGVAPGHAIFGAAGMDIWKEDVLRFLKEKLK